MPSLPVFSFTGGQTDNPLGAAPNKWEIADNLVISQDLKLESAPGGELMDSDDPRVDASSSSYRIGAVVNFFGSLFKHVVKTLQYFDGAAQVNLQGPETTPIDAFDTITSSETVVTSSYWNNHQFAVHDEEANLQAPVKWFYDGSDFFLTSAGLPLYPVTSGVANITLTSSGGSGNTYRYAFVYRYEYEVDGVTFVDRGAPSFKTLTNVGAPNTNSVSIDDFIAVSNPTTATHYDVTNTADLEIEVYRTTSSGSIFYLLTTVPHNQGTTAITDTTSDTTLAVNEPAYWTGGIAYNYRPPYCKIVHMTTSYGYYAAGNEVLVADSNGELLKNRLWQSKSNDPDSVPPQFYVDVEDEIVGVSSVRSIPIVFCKGGSVYRIDGYFDDFGRGGMIAQKINEVAGGIGQLSLVQSLDGVYFAGLDNWYFTDGFIVQPISDELRSTFASVTSTDLKKKRMCGAYDGIQKRVYWTCRIGDEGSDNENNAIAVCDIRNRAFLFWNSGFDGSVATTKTIGTTNTSDTATAADTSGMVVGQYIFAEGVPLNTFITSITANTSITMSADATATASVSAKFLEDSHRGPQFFQQFQPASITVLDGNLIIGDSRGYLIERIETEVTLPKIDTTVTPSSWGTNPIIYRYISAAQDFNRPDARKWCTQLVLHVRSKSDISSNLTLQPLSENDANNAPDTMKPMQNQFGTLWGDPSISYGDPVLYANISRLVIEKRRFPANSLRCSYKQVHLETLWANMQRSDIDGLGTITGSGTTRTVTIDGTWNSDCVDQVVTFVTDDYESEYKIIERASATAVVIAVPDDDITNDTDVAWLTRGFVKGDTISLVGYVIDFTLMDDTIKPFQGASNTNA